MSERLDRIEAILERNAEEIRDIQRLQADNATAIANNANSIKVLTEHQAQYAEQLRAEVTNLTTLTNTLAIQHGETIERVDTIVAEVRGLQTENRRIMERWGNGGGSNN